MSIRETDLYAPVKAHLEGLGFSVKAEVGDADVMAMRGDEPPVIVELKTGFSLILLQQAIARQRITDQVYVAVPRWKGKAGWRMFKGNIGLCRRLGVGVLSVATDGTVQVHCDPAPFKPRKSKQRQAKMEQEFLCREGDPNIGGSKGVTIVTAYRQDAEKCLAYLRDHGPTKGAIVARETGVRRATQIMADNHYGWFYRVERGVYSFVEER